jgi:hypothetical protein
MEPPKKNNTPKNRSQASDGQGPFWGGVLCSMLLSDRRPRAWAHIHVLLCVRVLQLGSSIIDFVYDQRDAIEVKTPLSSLPMEACTNPDLLSVREVPAYQLWRSENGTVLGRCLNQKRRGQVRKNLPGTRV